MMEEVAAMETEELMTYFTYGHLPEHLQAISEPFCELATQMNDELGDCGAKVMALTHLLIAKDAAVRAHLRFGAKS